MAAIYQEALFETHAPGPEKKAWVPQITAYASKVVAEDNFLPECCLRRQRQYRPAEELLPSEKAFAYKMKMDAMRRQGTRADLTCGQNDHKFAGMKSRDILAEEVGER